MPQADGAIEGDQPRALLPDRQWPSVTVAVINLDGRDYLERCLSSLRAQDYPADRIEVVVIDNASTDGSVEYVREAFGEIRVVVNETNTGFAPAVNQAAKLAGGRYLALLNNDAEADPGWLREAVNTLEMRDRAACAASKILREDRRTIDFAGGQLSFYGHGFAKDVEHPDAGDGASRPTLFASGGAMVVRTKVFRDVGGFDDSYFAFFEDVDFGWRLWLYGHEVLYVPSSVVYHRHHGTIERFGYARERYLLERNALATIFKNYSDEKLAKILPGALILMLARGLDSADTPLPDFRIADGDAEPIEAVEIPGLAAAHLAALRDWALDLDELLAKRQMVQSRRVVEDRVVLRLFEQSMQPNIRNAEFLKAFANVIATFELGDHARARSRVLIITEDRIGPRMAGPAIRCWEMANLLAHEHEVTLASMKPVELSHESFRTAQVDAGSVTPLLAEAEVIIFQGFVMHLFPAIERLDVPVLVDVYDPFHLEGLELRKHERPEERFATAHSDTEVLNRQFARADFLVCASEKQRDFWLGQLASIGRVNPATYDADESLRSLIDVAPFGLPSTPPEKRERVVKGVVDGIGEEDFLLLWGGGIYNWFDPLTLIRAVGALADDHPEIKLFFLGSGHPNPSVPTMRMAATARELAEELGLLGTQVFFNDGWVEYERRADYLLEADLGVSTHFDHIETAFSYRTRILDYLWASLPIVATQGDSLSRLVTTHGLGLTVPAEDVDALAEAIRRLREDKDLYASCQSSVEALAPEMTWEKALAPIMDFCRRPHRAPDKAGRPATYVRGGTAGLGRSARYYARRFFAYYRSAGAKTALTHARNFTRARLGR